MPTSINCEGDILQVGGLTILQRFAAMAMQGMLSKEAWMERISNEKSGAHINMVVESSVKCADALINELNKQNEN